MKRFFAIIILTAVVMTAAAQDQVTITKFNGKTITGVDASGVFDIKITQGANTSASINIPKRLQDVMKFDIDATGKIILGIKSNSGVQLKKGETFTATIVCSSLSAIQLSGSCEIEGSGRFVGNSLSIGMSGATSVEIPSIDVTGNVTIGMSGSSEVKMGINATGNIDIKTSGASEVALSGRAASASIGVSGSSEIEMADMVAKAVKFNGSGSSEARLNATETLTVGASGSVEVEYRGNPKLSVSTSGSARISPIQ